VPQLAMEMILARQFASCLTMPVFLVDPEGNLLFFNEPAEPILGRRFEEIGEMPMAEWSTIFEPLDLDGSPLPLEEIPLVITLRERQPAHSTFSIVGLDAIQRKIEATSFPIVGVGERYLGAIAFFWEVSPE
jgi:PAS domain-containing protein